MSEPDTPDVSTRTANPLRIVAFGSSSTESVGATNPAATYPAKLQQILAGILPGGRKVEVINRGIRGENADNMARRLQADVIADTRAADSTSHARSGLTRLAKWFAGGIVTDVQLPGGWRL